MMMASLIIVVLFKEETKLMALTQPIRDKKTVHELMDSFLKKKQYRNYVMVAMGVYTALRIGDLLKLKWKDVYDFDNHKYFEHVTLQEQKTKKNKIIAMNTEIIKALEIYFSFLGTPEQDSPVFCSNRKDGTAISRIQAYRIIRSAASSLQISGKISCHSLRKTFGYHAWKSGAPITVIMDIYNHSSMAVTKRYLGVCQDDRDEVYQLLHF